MGSIRWNNAAASGMATVSPSPSEPAAVAPASIEPGAVRRFLLRIRGAKPEEIVGAHLLRLSGAEGEYGAPCHHLDLFQTMDGGFAASIVEASDGEEKSIGLCKGLSLADVADHCSVFDVTAGLNPQAALRGLPTEQLEPIVRLECLRAYLNGVQENFDQLICRLRQRPEAQQA